MFLFLDVDGNGAIDPTELKYCFHKLEINFTDEEINDLFEACDINHHMGIKFNEFIVLLCLAYLLRDNSNALHAVSIYSFFLDPFYLAKHSFIFTCHSFILYSIFSLLFQCYSLTLTAIRDGSAKS